MNADRLTDDRLSAWLDGELAPAERAQLDDELARSAQLRAEIAAISAVRGLVRSLPAVDPPFGFFERLGRTVAQASTPTPSIRSQSARRRLVGSVVAVAAAWLLILGFGAGVGALRVVPPLDALADRHATAYAAGDGYTEMAMADAKVLGPAMGDMPLVAAWHDATVVQLVYADARGTISVFRQRGSLDGEHLPAGGAAMAVGGMAAWSTEMHDLKVVVVDGGDAVYTVVGGMANTDHVVSMAGAVPLVHRSGSFWAITRRGVERVGDTVGF